MNRLLSIFDLTGNWSQPYKEAGWEVVKIDIQQGFDLHHWNYKALPKDYFKGILIAQPCTDFALCGAVHYRNKDANGSTYESMSLTYKSLAIVQYFLDGLEFWALENPASRIHKLVPELGKITLKFQPCDFAQYDPIPENSQYDKQTWLWGEFKIPKKRPLESLINGMDRHSQWGGKSDKTKNERSKTPMGFSYAFFEANQ